MEVTVAALADHASLSDGKLNVLGVFDVINAHSVPAAHPRAVLVMRTLARNEDADKTVPMEIRLEDEDGRLTFKAQGEHRIGPIPPGGFATANLIIELQNLPLPKFGHYAIVISLGGVEKIRLPLNVVELQPPAGPAPA